MKSYTAVTAIGLMAALGATTAHAGLTITETSTASLLVTGDTLATELRGLGLAFWNANDGTAPELAPPGTTLFSTVTTSYSVDWKKLNQPLSFLGGDIAVWGIEKEAGDTSHLLATDADGTSFVMANQGDPSFSSSSFVISTDTVSPDLISLSLENQDPSYIGTSYSSLPQVVFATAVIGGLNYGLFNFDDRYASLDNHDDFIGLVRYDMVVPEPSVLLGFMTAGVLGILFLRRRK